MAKLSLREFQQGLLQRLKGAAEQAASTTARLGVLAGADNLLLRLDEAGEVLPVPLVSPVPLTRPWFLGLANIRGNLYSVIDFALFLGGEATPRNSDCRILLVAERYQTNVALLINRMLGLRNVHQLQKDEDAVAPAPWIVATYRDQSGRVWHELAVADLVTHQDFLQAGI